MCQKKLKDFLSTDGGSHAHIVRRLRAFYSAHGGKAIGAMSKLIYVLLVCMHCLKVAGQCVVRKEAWNANQAAVWRRQTGLPI
jgi:hypothetical protein